ncbi:MarP family serine protease [Corynebacterium auriscanis]|uniref:MarP family serine protease n=1 Tax=Corynebacterium auriscanis TaxID=99807 RepID=UPI003CEC7F0F
MTSGSSGSMIIDGVLIAVIIAAVASGWRQGGLSAFLGFVGVLLGGVLGVQLLPYVLEQSNQRIGDNSGTRLIVAIVTMTILIVAGYLIGSGTGASLRDKIRTRTGITVDSAVGAVVQVVTYLLVIWLILVPIASANKSNFGQELRNSRILSAVGTVVPEWMENLPSRTATMLNNSGLPLIAGPLDKLPASEVEAPDNALQRAPAVRQSRDAIIRVVGEANQCSRLLQGSGFVIQPDTILTNAHVVAGTNQVELDTTRGPARADVVYYNPEIDIAVLHSENLGIEPLTWADKPAESGDSAIVLGHPKGGPFVATPARIRERFTVSGPNIYATNRVEREAYSLRGTVVEGNSGGPLIDAQGRVLGLIFGADINDEETGYALTKDEVLKHTREALQAEVPVPTGKCVLK